MSSPLVQVIIGSTRPGRVGEPVARWFEGVAREHGGFDVEMVDLVEVGLPMFDEAKHPRLREYEHEHTKRWSAIVDRADAYVWVIPEYNYGVNAATKNAIDYLHQEWARKPVGIVSYGGVAAGTRSAQMLKQIAGALRMTTLTEAVNIPFVTQFLHDGRFVPNDELRTGAAGMLDELTLVAAVLGRLRRSSSVDVLKRFLEVEAAYMAAGGPEGGGDFDAFVPLLAEDAVMRQAANLPYGGDWVGHGGFRDFFAQLSRTWASIELSDLQFYEPVGGDDRVVVSMRQVATSRATGRVMDEPMVELVEISDGLVRNFWPIYYDVAEVNDVLDPEGASR
jgi:NAD(P)H-dependent FMN reductase/ketosteroid isomerase-like protein